MTVRRLITNTTLAAQRLLYVTQHHTGLSKRQLCAVKQNP